MKSMFLSGLLALFLCCGTLPSAGAAAISVEGMNVSISGPIARGDDETLRKLLGGPTAVTLAKLQSDGGDVGTSLAIGRILRARDSWTSTEHCYSSCVLIFVAGVHRSVVTEPYFGMGLGIHRPYFGDLPAGLTSAQIGARRNQIRADIVTYLQEMNVPVRLLEWMEATPPERMRILSTAENSELGLDAPDPVYDEKMVAKGANRYGTTSAEYRRRSLVVEGSCQPPGEPHDERDLHRYVDCAEAIRYGVPLALYRLRLARYEAKAETVGSIANSHLDSSGDDGDDRCRRQIVAFGARECGD